MEESGGGQILQISVGSLWIPGSSVVDTVLQVKPSEGFGADTRSGF